VDTLGGTRRRVTHHSGKGHARTWNQSGETESLIPCRAAMRYSVRRVTPSHSTARFRFPLARSSAKSGCRRSARGIVLAGLRRGGLPPAASTVLGLAAKARPASGPAAPPLGGHRWSTPGTLVKSRAWSYGRKDLTRDGPSAAANATSVRHHRTSDSFQQATSGIRRGRCPGGKVFAGCRPGSGAIRPTTR